MIHGEENAAAELERVRQRPPIESAEFDDEDLPTDEFPDWFTRASARDDEVPPQEFVRHGRTAYADRSGGGPWPLQNWIYRFDPDEDSRGREFWDIVPVDPSRLRVRVDSWGESFFGSLELLWLLYADGATHVEGPVVHKAGTDSIPCHV